MKTVYSLLGEKSVPFLNTRIYAEKNRLRRAGGKSPPCTPLESTQSVKEPKLLLSAPHRPDIVAVRLVVDVRMSQSEGTGKEIDILSPDFG